MRPIIFLIAICSLILPSQLLAGEQEADSQTSQPNIVMLISDDQAWNDYSFMGHQHVETPSLDRLAKQSVLFRRGYVPTSLCRPSLMTIITGRYAHQHGVTGNDPSLKYAKRGSEQHAARRAELIKFVDRYETLPRRLSKAGYLCFQTGKWWEGSPQQGGFTSGMTRGFPQRGGRHGDDGLKIGREGIEPITTFIDDAVKQKKPFFLWYAPFMPHTPHQPPKRLFEKYKQMRSAQDGNLLNERVAKYYAMCEWFDETCGAVLKQLDDLNIADDTIIVYVCDNGWIQNPEANGYGPRSKQTPFEGGVRTPIMFRWPGKWKPADRKELCSSIDLMPTLLTAVGQEPPSGLPGLDLTHALADGSPIERDTIFGEGFAHDIADLNNPEASLIYRWCIQGQWKLLLTYDGEINRYKTTHARDMDGPQLFNLADDPFERKNVALENPDQVAELSKKIGSWYKLKERKLVWEK